VARELVERERRIILTRVELERHAGQIADQQWDVAGLEQALDVDVAMTGADMRTSPRQEVEVHAKKVTETASEIGRMRPNPRAEERQDNGAVSADEAKPEDNHADATTEDESLSRDQEEPETDRGVLIPYGPVPDAESEREREELTNQMRKLRRDAKRRAMGEL